MQAATTFTMGDVLNINSKGQSAVTLTGYFDGANFNLTNYDNTSASVERGIMLQLGKWGGITSSTANVGLAGQCSANDIQRRLIQL